LEIIADILSTNRFRIKTTDTLTPWAPVNIGVREGGVLSPLLFSLFFADLIREVFPPDHFSPVLGDDEYCEVGVFADDVVFFSLSVRAMQDRLNKLWTYCNNKGLEVNAGKTEVMTFTLTDRISNAPMFPAFYNGTLLPTTSDFKYLGFWLTRNMDQRVHFEKRLAKFKAAASSLVAFVKRLRILKPDVISNLFSSLVSSQMFGSEFLFIPMDELNIEKRNFICKCFGLPMGTNASFLDNVFSSIQESDRHLLEKSTLYNRLVSAPRDTLHSVALRYDVDTLKRCLNLGWVGKVEQQFASRGFRSIPSRTEAALELSESFHKRTWRNMSFMSTTDFTTDVFPARPFLIEFLNFTSNLNPDKFRMLISFLVGTFSWSCLRSPSQFCFFCPSVSLTPIHMILCSHLRKWRIERIGANVTFGAECQRLALEKNWSALSLLFFDLCLAWKMRETVSSEIESLA